MSCFRFPRRRSRQAAFELESVPLREVVERAIEQENLAGAGIAMQIAEDLLVQRPTPNLLRRAISNFLRNAREVPPVTPRPAERRRSAQAMR